MAQRRVAEAKSFNDSVLINNSKTVKRKFIYATDIIDGRKIGIIEWKVV